MKIKIKNIKLLYSAIIIAVILFLSSFIEVNLESGANYNLTDTLLGIIIFHNVYVLSIIILLVALMLAKSLSV